VPTFKGQFMRKYCGELNLVSNETQYHTVSRMEIILKTITFFINSMTFFIKLGKFLKK